jgi:hypothetical protein
MLVEVGAVEFAKSIWSFGMHPIENDADFCRMGRFDYCGGIWPPIPELPAEAWRLGRLDGTFCRRDQGLQPPGRYRARSVWWLRHDIDCCTEIGTQGPFDRI